MTPPTPEPGPSEDAKSLFIESAAYAEQRRWEAAIKLATRAGNRAEENGDAATLIEAGTLLERLGEYSLSGRFLARAGLINKPCPVPEWAGESLAGKTLLVMQRMRHIGSPIRMARLIPVVAGPAKRCVMLCERRLVPLLRRSFPDFDVREAGADDGAALAEADVAASYETLQAYTPIDARMNAFRLRADAARVQALRQRYLAGALGPLVGICWHSTNSRKDLPSLSDWQAALPEIPGTLVSLQYGDVAADVAALSQAGRNVIWDSEVDGLTDLDGFAAQVSAMDAVFAISGTGVHVAGALGVPATVLLDDRQLLIWSPWSSSGEPWYRDVALVRRQARPWDAVFAQATASLRKQLGLEF